MKLDNDMISEQGILIKYILMKYLEKKGLRRTSERFAILEEIYSKNGHFDIESLYISMKNKKYQVSRATLYNNIDILIDAGLVKKHQFGKNTASYEKSFSRLQHDHLICTECGTVMEFCDPRIIDIERLIEKTYDFKTKSHSLYFYGLCEECAKKENELEQK